MTIIEIKALENGAHRNQTGDFAVIPEGWAAIPKDMFCGNFPFGEVEAAEINGVMTVTKWTAGEIPSPVEPTATEQRENAYNTEKVIAWDGEILTVTEAATLWSYYAAEGSEKAPLLQTLIATAKAKIREEYPDEAAT